MTLAKRLLSPFLPPHAQGELVQLDGVAGAADADTQSDLMEEGE